MHLDKIYLKRLRNPNDKSFESETGKNIIEYLKLELKHNKK